MLSSLKARPTLFPSLQRSFSTQSAVQLYVYPFMNYTYPSTATTTTTTTTTSHLSSNTAINTSAYHTTTTTTSSFPSSSSSFSSSAPSTSSSDHHTTSLLSHHTTAPLTTPIHPHDALASSIPMFRVPNDFHPLDLVLHASKPKSRRRPFPLNYAQL